MTKASEDAQSDCATRDDARTRLIEEHMPVAQKIARGFQAPHYIERADILAAAYSGLIAAADQYDPTKRSTFRGYASRKIRWYIMQALRDRHPVPYKARYAAKKAGEEPPLNPTSLDMLLQEIEECDTPDALIDEDVVTREVFSLAQKQMFADLLCELPENQRLIIHLRYYREMSWLEVAEASGYPYTYVRAYLHNKALQHLKRLLERSGEEKDQNGTNDKPSPRP